MKKLICIEIEKRKSEELFEERFYRFEVVLKATMQDNMGEIRQHMDRVGFAKDPEKNETLTVREILAATNAMIRSFCDLKKAPYHRLEFVEGYKIEYENGKEKRRFCTLFLEVVSKGQYGIYGDRRKGTLEFDSVVTPEQLCDGINQMLSMEVQRMSEEMAI